MAYLNVKERVIEAKIVFYGAGLSGKTTNLEQIKKLSTDGRCGEMMSLDTDGDRTLFFDWMPFNLGKFNGCDVKMQLYTVPGQQKYSETRKKVLAGADGVVLVLDSQSGALEKNREIIADLRDQISSHALDGTRVPVIVQLNKRDLPTAMAAIDLLEACSISDWPHVEAVAATGVGVFETLQEASRRVLQVMREDARTKGSNIRTGEASGLDGDTMYQKLVADGTAPRVPSNGGHTLPSTDGTASTGVGARPPAAASPIATKYDAFVASPEMRSAGISIGRTPSHEPSIVPPGDGRLGGNGSFSQAAPAKPTGAATSIGKAAHANGPLSGAPGDRGASSPPRNGAAQMQTQSHAAPVHIQELAAAQRSLVRRLDGLEQTLDATITRALSVIEERLVAATASAVTAQLELVLPRVVQTIVVTIDAAKKASDEATATLLRSTEERLFEHVSKELDGLKARLLTAEDVSKLETNLDRRIGETRQHLAQKTEAAFAHFAGEVKAYSATAASATAMDAFQGQLEKRILDLRASMPNASALEKLGVTSSSILEEVKAAARAISDKIENEASRAARIETAAEKMDARTQERLGSLDRIIKDGRDGTSAQFRLIDNRFQELNETLMKIDEDAKAKRGWFR